MKKLYKRQNGFLYYFEAWDRDGIAIVHSGRVGDRGTSRELRPGSGESVEIVISRELGNAQSQGYRLVDAEAHYSVVVQYNVEGWEADEALGFRRTVEEVLNDALGWNGVGHCDGGDVGRKTINVWCKVVDLECGKQSVLFALQYNGLLEDVVLAASDNHDYTPFYPPGYWGPFKL
jgi:hypothetical protein